MFSRRRKFPPNYLRVDTEGYGLWEIWFDQGDGTHAAQIMKGMRPLLFLTVDSAKDRALELAEYNPERRYKVVLAR